MQNVLKTTIFVTMEAINLDQEIFNPWLPATRLYSYGAIRAA